MAEVSPSTRSTTKLNSRILNRINETMNGSQSQLHSLITSAANAVSSMISSPNTTTSIVQQQQRDPNTNTNTNNNNHATNLVINSSSTSSSASSSSQHTPNQAAENVDNIGDGGTISLPSNWSYNHSITSSIKLEKKMFDKVNKLAEKLLKHCQSERMQLINSPPYIIDILPDICQLFNTIYFVYENKLAQLNEIDYFCVCMRNCLEKFQELADLFKVAGKRMYEESSVERQKLVKYTLTYSHILAEMKSLFPKDVYEGENFRIAKKDAAEFWKLNFGDRVIVSWKEFELKLNKVHQISNVMELNSLRETIQLTKTKYVSIFEFDIFTSCTKLGQWAIGYVTGEHKILQTIPQSLIQALIDGQKQGLYVHPDGRDIKIDISSAIAIMSASRIQCSREQYEMYCDMGTSFQVCKICSENNKDRKLEPCGHLICSTCLENWQELQPHPSCPFCRCEIKTFEPVIISPFESNSSNKATMPTTTTTTAAAVKKRTSQGLLVTGDSATGVPDDFLVISRRPMMADSSQKKKESIKSSNLVVKENDCPTQSPMTSGGASTITVRSESMRCGGSSAMETRSLLNDTPTTDMLLQSSLQTMSLNSLNQSTSGDLNNSKCIINEDDVDYLKPYHKPTSSGPNSVRNSSGHLAHNPSHPDADKHSNSTESTTSSSSSASTSAENTKFNLDLLLNNRQSDPTGPTNGHLNNNGATPPTPLIRQNKTSSTSSIPMPISMYPPPPPIPPHASILSPPQLPPPPPPPTTTTTTMPLSIPPLVVSDASFTSPSKNSIRLKIENELMFEQMMVQLETADRMKAACALFLANSDLKLAKTILNSLKL